MGKDSIGSSYKIVRCWRIDNDDDDDYDDDDDDERGNHTNAHTHTHNSHKPAGLVLAKKL